MRENSLCSFIQQKLTAGAGFGCVRKANIFCNIFYKTTNANTKKLAYEKLFQISQLITLFKFHRYRDIKVTVKKSSPLTWDQINFS